MIFADFSDNFAVKHYHLSFYSHLSDTIYYLIVSRFLTPLLRRREVPTLYYLKYLSTLCNITLNSIHRSVGLTDRPLLSSLLSPLISLSYPAIFQCSSRFFFLENHIEVEGSRFVSFLSQFVFQRRPFSLKSLWIVYWISPCSVLQALHKIPDSFNHPFSLVGIKRPLGCSLTYALRIYIGISIIAKRYLLQNTSVKNDESSCSGRPFSPRMHLQADFFSTIGGLSEERQHERQASCCCTHSFVANQTIITKTLRLNIGRANPSITIICYRGDTSSCVCALPLYTVDLILSTKI